MPAKSTEERKKDRDKDRDKGRRKRLKGNPL